jgi:CheY-like chemotaxis protein
MTEAATAKIRINLERAVVLVVDNSLGLDILSSIFLGFGVRNLHRSQTLAEAREIVQSYQVDLIVMESLLPDQDVYEFVQALRRSETAENRFAPIVLLSAHTAASKVRRARDSGANFLIGKPISAKVLLERIMWVAREKRQFLETDTFVGPDRRFHDIGQPEGTPGRRKSDVAAASMTHAMDSIALGEEGEL